MTEHNGSKKWDAKAVVIAGLITLIPVSIGLTYNIVSWSHNTSIAQTSRLESKVDKLTEEMSGIKVQLARLEGKLGEKP